MGPKKPAPAPDYWLSLAKYSFPRKLVKGIFFRAAPAPWGQKKPAPAPDYWLSLAKYSFPRKLVKGKTDKKYKTSKIIVYSTIQTYYSKEE